MFDSQLGRQGAQDGNCSLGDWIRAAVDLIQKELDFLVCIYQGNKMTRMIERVQTGVRLEKRLLKVLKALAEHLDLSLGDLLEGMVLHCFEGTAPFSAETEAKISMLKEVYGLDLTARDSHKLTEVPHDK
jgi:hypothetical protein